MREIKAQPEARARRDGGQTFFISKPSTSNTIVMVKNQSDFPGMTYEAKFLVESLGKKYDIKKT